jgi:hypothetical protein
MDPADPSRQGPVLFQPSPLRFLPGRSASWPPRTIAQSGSSWIAGHHPFWMIRLIASLTPVAGWVQLAVRACRRRDPQIRGGDRPAHSAEIGGRRGHPQARRLSAAGCRCLGRAGTVSLGRLASELADQQERPVAGSRRLLRPNAEQLQQAGRYAEKRRRPPFVPRRAPLPRRRRT